MKTSRLMRKLTLLLSAIRVLASLSPGQEQSAPPAPDWSKRTFSAPLARYLLPPLNQSLRNITK